MRVTKQLRRLGVIISCFLLVLLHDVSSAASHDNDEPNQQQQQQQQQQNDIDNNIDNNDESYGVDVSFPIHNRVSTNYAWLPHNNININKKKKHKHNINNNNNEEDEEEDKFKMAIPDKYRGMPVQPLGDRQAIYAKHLEGCHNAYKTSNMCDVYEYDRILMNNRQPQSMQNYTKTGFQKITAPPKVIELIKQFWEKNKHNQKKQPEVWPEGSTYTNHWDSPTYMLSVDDNGLRGSGTTLKNKVWEAARETLEVWTQEELTPTSIYGIRVYTEGAILLPHVDRLPLVASAMVNVAQDVDEDWPMEIYDHEGRAHNVTLAPGDMLLFESHSILHGRPFPLKGRMYAMLFIHFEPTGHTLRHMDAVAAAAASDSDEPERLIQTITTSAAEAAAMVAEDVDDQYEQASKANIGGQSAAAAGASATTTTTDSLLPPYIKRFSPEEENWLRLHPEGWHAPASPPAAAKEEAKKGNAASNAADANADAAQAQTKKSPKAHRAAAEGNLKKLQQVLAHKSAKKDVIVHKRDDKGWQPIHEGAYAGHMDVVEMLVDHGADVNARTAGGRGGTPLYLAQHHLGRRHPMVKYLKSLGALNVGPEQHTEL